MSRALGVGNPLHPGSPAWQATRRRSLEGIRTAATQPTVLGNIGAIADMASSHVDNVEIRAAAVDQVSRTKPWVPAFDPFVAAQDLNLRALPRSTRSGRWHWIPKNNGGHRLACSLSWQLRVGQLLVKDVLLAAHVPADHIGDWQGRGPTYHLGRLVDDLQHGGIVLLGDVRSCFSSVHPDAVCELGILPSDLVASCFDARRIRLRAPCSRQRSPIGPTFERTGRHGLLSGGSASSLLWAMMINDLPGALPVGVRANTYVDNVTIVCRSTQECDDAEAALIRYFADHPAGPFFLTTSRADAEAGFDHLGHCIEVRAGQVVVGIKGARLPCLEQRTLEAVAAIDGAITDFEFERIVHDLLSPWPMLSACSRDALVEVIRLECDLHNVGLHRSPD